MAYLTPFGAVSSFVRGNAIAVVEVYCDRGLCDVNLGVGSLIVYLGEEYMVGGVEDDRRNALAGTVPALRGCLKWWCRRYNMR